MAWRYVVPTFAYVFVVQGNRWNMDARMTYDKVAALVVLGKDTLKNESTEKLGWTWTIDGIPGATVTTTDPSDSTRAEVKTHSPGTVTVTATFANGVTNHATIVFDPLPIVSAEIHVSEAP